MALIKCEDCGKEISDKADSCVNCGCPIRETDIETNNTKEKTTTKQEQNDSSQHKKFNFDAFHELKQKEETKKKIANTISKESSSLSKISFIIFIISTTLFFVMSANKVDGFLAVIALFIFLIAVLTLWYTIKYFFKKIKPQPFVNSYIDDLMISKYYKRKLPIIPKPQEENLFSVIDFITAESKDELINEAFYVQADALIEPNFQKYSTTNVKDNFNGIGGKRYVTSDVKVHENWTATAVKFNTTDYHENFDYNKYI